MERLGMLLIGKRYGIFKNDKGEYCQVSRSYQNNKEKYSIIFSDGKIGSFANKPAIHTIVEKKVVKILKEGSYSLNQ
ncbi:MAG: hypothetical protein K9I82_01585 [Chitinophagaceae bacterium]|nr:hypothetical protein [Chitinophagaceae bacterium]